MPALRRVSGYVSGCSTLSSTLICSSSWMARRSIGSLLPLDRITQTASPRLDVRLYKGGDKTTSSRGLCPASPAHSAASSGRPSMMGSSDDTGTDSTTFHFALRDEDRGWYDRGVSLEAKAFIAEAEEAYARSWAALHDIPGGALVERLPETRDAETDEVVSPSRTVFTAPFGETYVPGSKAGYAMRGQVGELADQQAQMKQARGDGPAWDLHAQLNLRKERQLEMLLCSSPDMPLLEKAGEVERRLSRDFYPQRLVLQPGTAELAMELFAQASLRCRITGESSDPPTGMLSSMDATTPSFSSSSPLPSLSPTASASSGGNRGEERHDDGEGTHREDSPTGAASTTLSNAATIVEERVLNPSTPPRTTTATPMTGAAPYYTMETMPFLSAMRQLYTHQKKFSVAPTAQMIQSLMVTLSAVRCPSSSAENGDGGAARKSESRGGRYSPSFHLAQRLLLDCDRFVVLPSHTTLTAYIRICHLHNEMGFALAQLRHAMKNLSIPLDADMTAALLRGLTQCGQVEEALALLARIQRIPVTVELINASLETLLLSPDPLSCFSVYEACVGGEGTRRGKLRPNAETFSLLLLACEQSGQWGASRWIASEMQRHQVKGSPTCLNLLLKGLLKERRTASAAELHATMRKKDVAVWPALERGLISALQP